MKKKVLLLLILFLVCFSTTASALTTEERAGVDRGGLHSYIQWFEDYSGVLIVATTHVNDSGVMAADITVTAACVNSSRNFRLRIYDSDVGEFIEADNEDGIGVKNRNFQVRVHMDSDILLWTVFVTDLSREVVYAQILLLYIYDPDAEYIPSGEEDDDSISKEEHEKEKRKWRIKAWSWSAQIITGTIIAIFLAKKLANRFWGCA